MDVSNDATSEVTNIIKLFLIDDHTMVRQGISALLEAETDFDIVGEAGQAEGAIEKLRNSGANVVLLDLTLPDSSGLEICRQISKVLPDIAVLILTMHAEPEYVAEAFRNGAAGYLVKEAAAEQLAPAIRAVATGESYLGPGLDPAVLQNAVKISDDDPFVILTERERQILKHIAQGLSNRLISEQLGVSIKTVDTHRWRMMRKLDIHDQTTLVKYAIRKGLVQIH